MIMQSLKFDNKKTGWVSLPGGTRKVVAHFNDGNKETYDLVDFLILKKRTKDKIVSIDIYKEGETIKD